MKTLLVYDGLKDSVDNVEGVDAILDLRRDKIENINLMDLYESVHPEMIGILRQEIIDMAPQRIVALGRLEEYLWNGTVISRCFGQFNSWNTQRSNPFGKTIISVNGNPVELIAIESLADWNYVA